MILVKVAGDVPENIRHAFELVGHQPLHLIHLALRSERSGITEITEVDLFFHLVEAVAGFGKVFREMNFAKLCVA